MKEDLFNSEEFKELKKSLDSIDTEEELKDIKFTKKDIESLKRMAKELDKLD